MPAKAAMIGKCTKTNENQKIPIELYLIFTNSVVRYRTIIIRKVFQDEQPQKTQKLHYGHCKISAHSQSFNAVAL